MTQIIAAITQEYVLLVSDRRLTFLEGPARGQLADDDTCKLVSLCNICGIGYTGLARLEGVPTHEWIAKTLASEECSDPASASHVLSERATAALSGVSSALRRHTFVIAGWAYFENLMGLRPHVCAVTNMMDTSGQTLATAEGTFRILPDALGDERDLAVRVIGQSLMWGRRQHLERNIGKLITREISPKEALRLLVDEIVNSSASFSTVGKKVLALCIPRKAAHSAMESGRSGLLAMQPSEEAASFCYYDATYSELQQFGPTLTCGGFAATDLKTENDPSIDRQSSQMKVLALPKKESRTAAPVGPVFTRPPVGGPVIGFEFGISVDNFVVPNTVYGIPAAIRNTGDSPIVFAQNLSDDVGQETPPSVQGGAIPAITFCWPDGNWSISDFRPVSRTMFAGIVIAPGEVFGFNFGHFRVPAAPMGSTSRSRVADLSIRFTDTISGTLLNFYGARFNFPTNVNPMLRFRISMRSISAALSFYPARVVDTASGELITGPVHGSPPGGRFVTCTDTAIRSGKPGFVVGRSNAGW